MSQLIPIIILSFLAWLWWDTNRAREKATRAALSACRQAGVQFLDQTVVLGKVRLRRDASGQVSLARLYQFEFSRQGQDRAGGFVAMLGHHVKEIHLNLLMDD